MNLGSLLSILLCVFMSSAFCFKITNKVQTISKGHFMVKNSGSGNIDTGKERDGEELGISVRLSDEERLQKIMARAGVASRRAAEEMIKDGRVNVNGKIVTELGLKVKPKRDIIIVDGKKIQIPDSTNVFWVVMNKPKGVLTTMEVLSLLY